MRIAVFSDLHLEFRTWSPPTNFECDVVVLARDIGIGTDGLRWANAHFDKPIIYVPGNHEFYDSEYHATLSELRSTAEALGIYLLSDNMVELNGITFIGATLWTDFGLLDNVDDAIWQAKRKMDDFRCIKFKQENIMRRLIPEDTLAFHHRSVAYITNALSKVYTTKNVVISHHSPSNHSTSPRYKGDYLSPAFTSNLDHLIERFNISVWIHGHTHHFVDYALNNTRVVSNQRGYKPFEHIPEFLDDFIVEI